VARLALPVSMLDAFLPPSGPHVAGEVTAVRLPCEPL
jgi:hypothetical protein